jgi:hypothetical protein
MMGESTGVFAPSMDPVSSLAGFGLNAPKRDCTIFRQQGYSRTKYSIRKDIPGQNIQSARIFQDKIFSQ